MTRDALLAVYQTELPRLRSVARRHLGGGSPDVEDVLQDVFLQAWLHCGALREDSCCAGWLFRMTANTCRTHLKRARHATPCDLPPVEESEDIYTRMMARLTMEDVLARLSPPVRQVVRLHAIEGYPLREVARRLQRPESTIKSALYRARSAMRSA